MVQRPVSAAKPTHSIWIVRARLVSQRSGGLISARAETSSGRCWKSRSDPLRHSAVKWGHDPLSRKAEMAPAAVRPSVVWWVIFQPPPTNAPPERPGTRAANGFHVPSGGCRARRPSRSVVTSARAGSCSGVPP
jgi:hypothetical protein